MDKKKDRKKKSRFSNALIFVWITVGVLLIWLIIEGIAMINTVKKYFP